MRGMFLV